MVDRSDPIEAALDKIDAEDGKSPGKKLRRILFALAATVVFTGSGAAVWYAYSTGVREGSEFAAPVLKPAGQSKIAPLDPGGRKILDQDKKVFSVIDGSSGGRQAERLLPPPENPLPRPMARKPVVKPPLATPKLAVPKQPPAPPSITAPERMPPPAKLAAGKPPPPKPVSKPEAKSDLKPASRPEPAAAPPPKPAPAIAKAVAALKANKPVPKAAKPAPGKGYRVQIASLRSAEGARRAWAERVKQSGGILAGLTLFVKRVEIPKKGTFYRVLAGPLLDKTAARRVCDALKQRNIGCFVSRP